MNNAFEKKRGINSIFGAISILILLAAILFARYWDIFHRLDNKLVSYDPWYHLEISEYILDSQSIVFSIPDAAVPTPIIYSSLIYPLSVILSQFTGLTLFNIYQIMGPFLLGLMNLGIYIIIRRITGKTVPAILGVTLFSSGYMTLTRTTMNLPENYGLFFLILILFIFTTKLDNRLIFFPLLGSIYYHYRSIAIFLLIFFLYIVLSFNAQPTPKNFQVKIKKYVIPSFIFIILIIPIIPEIFESYVFIVFQHIGASPSWKVVDPNPVIYMPLTLEDYSFYYGIHFLLFAFSGIIILYIEKKKSTLSLLLITAFIVSFLLTQSTRIGIYIQPYRFIIYFGIFASIISSISINKIETIYRNFRFVGIAIIASFIIILMITLLQPHGWIGIDDSDLEAVEYIKTQYNGSVMVSWGAPYYALDLPNSEWDPYAMANVFKANSEDELLDFLSNRYGNDKEIILAASNNGRKLLEQNNPNFFTNFKKYQIYKKGGVILYAIRT